MDLAILGNNSDDKGSQLERLTAKLLQALGYINIHTNLISSGGNEIDVTAEFIQPGINRESKRKLICECKAKRVPITTDQWLKFLGKIYMHQLKDGEVMGCFIALNGANGNVKGQFEEVQKHRSIDLISGEDLLAMLHRMFTLVSVQHIHTEVANHTERVILNTSLCYYDERIYWIIAFADATYTILDNEGNLISKDSSELLQSLIPNEFDFSTFVDLNEEKRQNDRFLFAKKYIMSILLLHKSGAMPEPEVWEACNATIGKFPKQTFLKEEINIGLKSLLAENIISESNSKFSLRALDQNRQVSDIIDFLKSFLDQFLIVIPLNCTNYKSLFSKNLLEAILNIQGNLKISPDLFNDWLRIIQWSPSALGWSLYPDPMLVHQGMVTDGNDSFYKTDINHCIQKLSSLFHQDFTNSMLTDFFYNNTDVIEVERNQVMNLKGKQSSLTKLSFNERIILAPLKVENAETERVIAIKLLDGQPEPWEQVQNSNS